MATHLLVGKKGEDIATEFLLQNGYRIIARNVRFARDEIDLVVWDMARAMTVFVEVKTRSRVSSTYPVSTAVDFRKRRCMSRAVSAWVAKHDEDGPGRIDVIGVSNGHVVEHILDVGSDFY